MSYILDALKKSQQERELGHVPTLESPTFLAEEEGARSNLWIVLAVILAALAVVIALYAVLRGGATAGSGSVASVAPAAPVKAPEPVGQAPSTGVPPSPAEPTSATSDPQQPVSSHPAPEPPSTDEPVVMAPPSAPAAPAQPIRDTLAAPKPPVSSTGRDRQSKVPPDLIADIEAFKQEVRGKQADATDGASAEQRVAPQDLRLPADVRGRLPEFIMSAHIYDSDPSRRFVLINGLKTREGEESREEITVEQILPDGAVLSFDGHRFFQRR